MYVLCIYMNRLIYTYVYISDKRLTVTAIVQMQCSSETL